MDSVFHPVWELSEHGFCTFSLLFLVSAFLGLPMHTYCFLGHHVCYRSSVISLRFSLCQADGIISADLSSHSLSSFCHLSSERTLFCGISILVIILFGELSLMSLFSSVQVTHSWGFCLFVCLLCFCFCFWGFFVLFFCFCLLTLDPKINAVVVSVCFFSKKCRSNRVLPNTSDWSGKPCVEQADPKLLTLLLLQPGEH